MLDTLIVQFLVTEDRNVSTDAHCLKHHKSWKTRSQQVPLQKVPALVSAIMIVVTLNYMTLIIEKLQKAQLECILVPFTPLS